MLRVLFVDDNSDLTRLIGIAISRESDMESAGELNSAERLVEELDRRQPHVVVLDLGLPGTDALELIGRMRQASPVVRIVVYSGYDDPHTIDKALQAGASGHVSKRQRLDRLFDSIRQIARGTPASH
jgi:DNA-binding NarL/FixJ family response regulator